MQLCVATRLGPYDIIAAIGGGGGLSRACERLFVEDFGSQNAICVGDDRVKWPVAVHDGDEIRLAREPMLVQAPRRESCGLTLKLSRNHE